MDPPYPMKCQNPECDFEKTVDSRDTNLPVENQRRIAETVASAHENRPRFGDRAGEEHPVRREWEAPPV